jgi:multidrug efflux pump
MTSMPVRRYTRSGSAVSLLAIPMFMMSPKELAPAEDQGVIFGIVDAAANFHPGPDQPLCGGGQRCLHERSGNRTSPSRSPRPIQVSAVWWSNPGMNGSAPFSKFCPRCSRSSANSRDPHVRRHAAGPARRGAISGGVRAGGHRRSPTEILSAICPQLQRKAMQSGMFAFPPIIDVKIDQPQSEIVIDRDKVADLGLDLQQVGKDIGLHGGRQFRQPLQHRRPQLQGHPPDQRVDRSTRTSCATSMSPVRTASWCP